MKNYEEMLEGLQRDIDVPGEVRLKFEQALDNLPEKRAGSANRIWLKMASFAAAVTLIGTGVCWTNPALAAKIPVIGKIFEQVEERVTFKGDYSGKGDILTIEADPVTEADTAAGAEADMAADTEAGTVADVAAETAYFAKDQGVGITASEIYCDGISLFLTAEITVEDGKLTNIPGYDYIMEHGIEDESSLLYTRGSWALEGETESIALENNNFEGMVLDDNTFIGMLKLDLPKQDISDGVLNLSLSRIGYDDIEMMDSDDISESHKFDGAWDFSIPFHVDGEHVKEVGIGKQLENGYAIEKAVVSPYQLVVYTDAPYLEPDYGYEYVDVVVYDADGKPLPPCNMIMPLEEDGSVSKDGMIRNVFPVQDRDISKVSIYLFDDFDYYISSQKGDRDAALEKSILSAEVEF